MPNDLVCLKNVSKTYSLGQTKVPAVRNLNLTLKKAEFTALIGTSGSGKSTLLNLIGCLDQPDSGEVWIDQVDVTKQSDRALSDFRNHKIGFVFQSFNLIPVLTAFENIELPLIPRKDLSAQMRKERVSKAIQNVGLEKFKDFLPDQLSGGQRQRVSIARALVTEPQILLADEPTANLDSKTAHEIIDLILDLNRKNGVTCLFSSHDEKLIKRVDRVIRIQDGQISS